MRSAFATVITLFFVAVGYTLLDDLRRRFSAGSVVVGAMMSLAVFLQPITEATGWSRACAFQPAAWMKVRRVPHGKDIDRMLPSIRSGSPKVALLFPDTRKAEIDYFRKSGIFPIMHTVVIKNEILKRHPWIAVSVVQGFQKAKDLCYRRMQARATSRWCGCRSSCRSRKPP